MLRKEREDLGGGSQECLTGHQPDGKRSGSAKDIGVIRLLRQHPERNDAKPVGSFFCGCG